MSRVLAVFAACSVLCAVLASARADSIDSNVRQLDDSSYRVRLAAVLALAKSHDVRAIYGVAGRARTDDDPSIRRIAALALAQMIDARTPEDAREYSANALRQIAKADADASVRDTAGKTLSTLAPLLGAGKPAPGGKKPEVFVNIDAATDQTAQMPRGTGDKITKIVRQSLDAKGFATSWPGGLPTSAELGRSRAFIVASTVKQIAITRVGGQTQIACTVAIRVAPWSGTDGGEKWEANRAASASGSAKAMTGNRDREVQGGVRDCLEAVAEDVTSRQVLPFLKRLVGS
ncbi:MAG: HEAT repeat domain-containing protein [Deltaproteobacteria bacterium]|nr:HEAT repeat domain-containing protein [Deltaproteobacteria bacterium]MCW5806131.1 HEAT repeat domain-containing protein [Deltaproteobacteria bacterium]